MLVYQRVILWFRLSLVTGWSNFSHQIIRACRSSMKPSRRTAICVSSRDGPGWLWAWVGPQLSELGIIKNHHISRKHRIGDDWSVFFFVFFRHFFIENERLNAHRISARHSQDRYPATGTCGRDLGLLRLVGEPRTPRGTSVCRWSYFWSQSRQGRQGPLRHGHGSKAIVSIFILDEHPKLPAILVWTEGCWCILTHRIHMNHTRLPNIRRQLADTNHVEQLQGVLPRKPVGAT